MARNTIDVDAPPTDVFEVLLDPYTYPHWVVGAKQVRSVDDDWPRPGSKFHHTVGAGPATVNDSSELIEVDPPHHLRLEVRFRPVGVGTVDFEVAPAAGGQSRITMSEAPKAGPVWHLWNRAMDTLTHVRNAVSLQRLKRQVERRGS